MIQPIVSFVIPVFNSGEYLISAVKSVLNNLMGRSDYEIILIDDKSTDPFTLKIFDDLAKLERVFVIKLSQNGGPAKARNEGLKVACGKWIAFLDADDIIAPNTLQRRFELIAKIPEIRWIAGDVVEMTLPDELSKISHLSHIKNNANEITPGTYRLIRPTQAMLEWAILPVLGAMMVRKDVFQEIGLLDERLTYGEDIHFCLLLSTCADFYWTQEPSLYLRRHHVSMMTDHFRNVSEAPKASNMLLHEKRMKPFRKQLRWKHSQNMRLLSDAQLSKGYRKAAINSALIALRWSINDMRNVRAVLNAILKNNFIISPN